MPGTASTGSTETIGFEGAIRTTSASAMDPTAPSDGAALSMPRWEKPVASPPARSRTHHSWKWMSLPSARRTCVSISSSVAGCSATPRSQREPSLRYTSDTEAPSRSHAVRAMCVPRSRSPSVNQSGAVPHAASSAATRSVSPCSAPAPGGVVHTGECIQQAVVIRSDSQTGDPPVVRCIDDHIDPVLLLGATRPLAHPRDELRAPDAATDYRDPHDSTLSRECLRISRVPMKQRRRSRRT